MHRSTSSRSTQPAVGVADDRVSTPGAIPPEICELCFSDLMQPLDADTDCSGTVRLTLRCPECHHIRSGECTWDEAREFGRHFAKGKAALRVSCAEIADENFRDELDCFILALHTELIGPDDFAPYRFSP
jgi:hypothetical protein